MRESQGGNPIGKALVTYNSVSIPTPWAVAGPHGQLASNILPWNKQKYKSTNIM